VWHCHTFCAAAVLAVEGSFAKATFNVVRAPVDSSVPDAIETKEGFCSLCIQEETLLLAPCGHAFCRICWQGYVSTALVDGSTTKVKQGAEDLLDLSQLQCPGCLSEDKYQAPAPAQFLSLYFVQAICPPAISHSFSSRICDQLASKFLRSNLPGALCSCGSAVVGMLQVKQRFSYPFDSIYFNPQIALYFRKTSLCAVAACVYRPLVTSSARTQPRTRGPRIRGHHVLLWATGTL
jgi:hypothetical protein